MTSMSNTTLPLQVRTCGCIRWLADEVTEGCRYATLCSCNYLRTKPVALL